MTRKKRGTLKPANSSIVIDLKQILATRNIRSPFTFLVKSGVSNTSAIKMLSGKAVQINMKQLTALCLHLNCTPNDLFALRDMQLPEHHALKDLPTVDNVAAPVNIDQWLAGKSLEEIKELMKQ